MHSIPGLAIDMLQAVLDGILITLALRTDKVVLIETDFAVEAETIRGHFLFLPEPEGLEQLLNAVNARG